MRTYGRITNQNGSKTWVTIETDENGFNDAVMVTTLIQCLLLNLGESPFYANFGIPAKPSIVQQIVPDYYVAQLQQQFSSSFASLIVAKQLSNPPTYRINITTHQGSKINASVPIPQ
jgi:hypothetical protein